MLLSLLETILVAYLMEKNSKADFNLQERNEDEHKYFQTENCNTGENSSTLFGLYCIKTQRNFFFIKKDDSQNDKVFFFLFIRVNYLCTKP